MLAQLFRVMVLAALFCPSHVIQMTAQATTISVLSMGDQDGDKVPRPPLSPLGIPDELYPLESLVANEEGHTTLQIEIAESGWVTSARVDGSSGFPSLDNAAVEIAKALWLFSPKAILVKPTTDLFKVDVAWSLPLTAPDQIEGLAKNQQSDLSLSEEMQPIGLYQRMTADDYPPQSQQENEQGRVFVRFVVREDGSVGAAQVMKSSGYSRLDNAAVLMIQRRWKYRPAMMNGVPMAVWHDANVVFTMPEPIAWPRQCRSAPSMVNQRVPRASRNGSLLIRRQVFANETGRILDSLILTQRGWMRPVERIRTLDHVTAYDPRTLRGVQPTKCWLDSDFTIKIQRQ